METDNLYPQILINRFQFTDLRISVYAFNFTVVYSRKCHNNKKQVFISIYIYKKGILINN